MEKGTISKATLSRLPRYLNFLYEINQEKVQNISATTIAKKLNLGEVQVRKDLNSISGDGKPKIGYITINLISCIEKCLSQNKSSKAIIIGAGNLGLALLEYDEFKNYGIEISAAFDIKTNIKTKSKLVLPIDNLKDFIKNENIKIGIITVDNCSAQKVCDLMVKNGIKTIWNFTACNLVVPTNVKVLDENLALSLAHLIQQNNI